MEQSPTHGAAVPYRVLLVDADPQHDLTTWIGDTTAAVTLADVLLDPTCVRSAIVPSRAGGAHIINGSREVAAVQNELKERHKSPYTVLRKVIDLVRSDYDFIFIDTARTMDLLSVSAIAAATEILSPIDCDPMAVKGLGLIRQSLSELEEAELLRARPTIRVLLTKYPGGKTQPAVVRDTVEYVRDLDVPVFNTAIRFSEQSRGAFPQGQTVFTLFPRSITADDYRALRAEFLSTLGAGPHIVVVSIEKGGVMKTSTVASLGHVLSMAVEPVAGGVA